MCRAWSLQGLLILELSLQLFTFQKLILRLGDETELVECLPSICKASSPAAYRLVRGSIGLQFQHLGGEGEGSIRDSASSWVIHSEVEASPNLIKILSPKRGKEYFYYFSPLYLFTILHLKIFICMYVCEHL